MITSAVEQKKSIFQLKGSLFTLTVLELYSTNLKLFGDMLKNKVDQAPLFFQSTPIVIDLAKLSDQDAALDFQTMLKVIHDHGLIPVGIRGCTPEQQSLAVAAGLGLMPNGRDTQESNPSGTQIAQSSGNNPTKVITKPIRSGQQVYAQGGDLLILSSVSTGAEVIADGHIHIYGPLRGRALAGVSGNESARIFCDCLEAELVSVAGFYKVNENLRNTAWKQRTHIFLENKTLHIESL